jgi:DNA-binding beta-propeller fold protein YncE
MKVDEVMGACRRVVGVDVAVVCMLLAASPATAATGFAPTGSFAAPESFGPVGVAVENVVGGFKGDVYVADYANGAVDRFSSAGAWQASASLPGVAPYQLAIDPTTGSVYVAGSATGTVYRLSPALALEKEITGLEEPHGASVDAAGNLFVVQANGTVLEFNSAGKPIDAAGAEDPANAVVSGLPRSEAVLASASGSDLYIATDEGTFHYELANGAYGPAESLLDPSPATGISFTADGTILLDQQTQFLDYEPLGTLFASGGSGTLSDGFGIAVNTQTNDVYVADLSTDLIDIFAEGSTPEPPATEAAQLTTPTTVRFEGTPAAGTTGYYFAYNEGSSCEGGFTTQAMPFSGGRVQAEAASLEPLKKYSYCLVATNAYGSTYGPVHTVETGRVMPQVSNTSFTAVGAHNATLKAQIDPENLPGRYYFQYATTPVSEAPSPASTVTAAYPEGHEPVAVSKEIANLAPNQAYYARVVAENADGEITKGAEVSFSTLAVGSSALPDKRLYELVSRSFKSSQEVYIPEAFSQLELGAAGVPTRFPFQTATNGQAITYLGDPAKGGYGRVGNGLGNQYLAKRSSDGEWESESVVLQPPARVATYFQGFSNDLEDGVLNSGTPVEPKAPPLPGEAPSAPSGGYPILYVRPSAAEAYRPLFTTNPLRSPTEFGSRIFTVGKNEPLPIFAGGSKDYSRLIFEANDALLPGDGTLEKELREDVQGEISEERSNNYLYESHEGRLQLVNVSPQGKVLPGATFGAPPFSKRPRRNPPDFSGAISEDGSRIYWTDEATNRIYVRVDGERTIPISVGAGRYWNSADDGRYAVYTEGEGQESALYRFDAEGERREALSGPNAGVLGVLGISGDGQEVYAVASAVLGSGVSSEGEEAVAGEPNLYLFSPGKAPVFVATLTAVDGTEAEPFGSLRAIEVGGEAGDWQPGMARRTAELSADGKSLVFMSTRGLRSVGYPSGAPSSALDEVYLFNSRANQLTCVSCSSSGESPPGFIDGAAAFLPIGWSDTALPQWISADGNRVFFDSAVPLVAQDTNGRQDVYEWEREGTGSCASGTGVNGGCAYLLSAGSSPASSWFVGASASGDDAFIVTRSALVPEDEDAGAFDLYDAHVGGVAPPVPSICTGTGCQGSPAPPPTFASPPSASFTGVGNFPPPKEPTRAEKLTKALAQCRIKHNKSKRKACEAQARRRYGAKREASVPRKRRHKPRGKGSKRESTAQRAARGGTQHV